MRFEHIKCHHQDLKHFLRLHIGPDSSLAVYPTGVDRVGRKWKLRPEDPADDPWFAPNGPESEPHLIEEPVRIDAPSFAAAPGPE